MDLAVDMAEENKSSEDGLALYEAIRKPFAVYNNDEVRMFALIRMGLNLDRGPSGSHVVDSIAATEPHIPWNWGFLKIRSACYTASRHPLAADAQSDLVDYLMAEPGGMEKTNVATMQPR